MRTFLETYLPSEFFAAQPLSFTPFGGLGDPDFAQIQRALRRKAYFGVPLSYEPNALTEVAWLLDNRPSDQINVDVEELDRIADGMQTEEDRCSLAMGWFDGVLTSVEWWRSASESLLSKADLSLDPALAKQREEILRLLTEVLLAYVPALREQDHHKCGRASLLLLKCYRRFTRSVCSLARELFPGTSYAPIDLTPLLERA